MSVMINAFFGMGIYSVVYEMGVEQTYPIGEATSHGFINTLANLFSFIIILILTPILNKQLQYGD